MCGMRDKYGCGTSFSFSLQTAQPYICYAMHFFSKAKIKFIYYYVQWHCKPVIYSI